MLIIPRADRLTRRLLIIAGLVVLVWSGFEDNGVIGVAILGWLLAILGAIVLITSRFAGFAMTRSTLIKLSPLIGAIVGAMSTLVVVALMLFKDARHAHIFPDYPPQMMLDMLTRLPSWTISGALISLGVCLLWVTRPLKSTDKGDNNSTD